MKQTSIWLLLISALVFVACSKEEGYTENERTEAYFLDKLNGQISPMQWWKTAVTLSINVQTSCEVKIWAMSNDDTYTLYDYKFVKQSGTYTMSVPQGKGSVIKLCYVCNDKKGAKNISLTGKSIEQITLNTGSSSKSPEQKYAGVFMPPMDGNAGSEGDDDGPHYDPDVDRSLHGTSVDGHAEHYEFTLAQKQELVEMLKILSKESINAKTVHHLNCNYELRSNGPFHITWLTGYESSQNSHILGYYFHSPNTYSDIEFHDLAETHKYDIIDGYAKVQYQLRDTSIIAHPEYGLEAYKWYDANFDMRDLFGSKTASNNKRIGDKAYNGLEIFKIFTTGVCRLRGLSFLVDVPEGKELGFYLKKDELKSPAQWDVLKRYNIKNIGERDEWKATNFSAEALNSEKTHRSCIIPYESTTWMGMEDVFNGGDFDCNDVIFGITAETEILKPTPVEPDIDHFVEVGDAMPWTIAYEDIGRNPDFDFNDAVIKLMPDYDNELCCVTVQAAGSNSRMYLHYDGPNGDVNMGEIHELLGGHSGAKINTTTSVAEIPFVEIDCVPWPKDYTMANDAKRFWIEIQRGTCEDCTDIITLAYEPGKIPEALLVAGEWKWPMEGVHIFSAYNSFPYWAKDITKTSYWNWYSYPKVGTVVDK